MLKLVGHSKTKCISSQKTTKPPNCLITITTSNVIDQGTARVIAKSISYLLVKEKKLP